jgi:hypothetical protein
MSDVQHAFWIRNADSDPVLLCLEPWANETHLASGKEYVVVFEGPAGGCPGIELSKDRTTAYGFSGSVAAVYLGGDVILACPTRVPAMPEPR